MCLALAWVGCGPAGGDGRDVRDGGQQAPAPPGAQPATPSPKDAEPATSDPLEMYGRGTLRAEHRSPPDVQGRIRRIRLVELEGDLYLLDETLSSDGDVLSHLAMFGDHVIARARPGVPASDMATAAHKRGGQVRSDLGVNGLYLVAFPREAAIDDVQRGNLPAARFAEALSQEPEVDYAEPDYVNYPQVTPNDPQFTSLWGMTRVGAPAAWDTQTGSASVKVGVIDTGVDYTHPDLAANIWTNPGEIPANGIDDDGNGYVDDVHGWDFGAGDNNPMDPHGHGTHVSGTIGAVGNNGVGVAGVCWNVRIVCLKIRRPSGALLTSAAVQSVYYATNNGCILTSNSWGGGGYSTSLYNAISNANSAGVLFVAAAGNSSRNTDSSTFYPAGYPLMNIISVAATNSSDGRASFSNYGASSVDLGAPGVGIRSTFPGSDYRTWSGTSMATPMVSGACALVKAQFPSYTHLQIKDRILTTVTPVAALSGLVASGGRLNVAEAINGMSAPPPAPPPPTPPPPGPAPVPGIAITTFAGTGATINVTGYEYYTARTPTTGNTSLSPVAIGTPAYAGFYAAHTRRWTFVNGGAVVDQGGRAVWATSGNSISLPLSGDSTPRTVYVYVSIYQGVAGTGSYTLSTGGAPVTLAKSTTGVTLYRFEVTFSGSITFSVTSDTTMSSSTVTLGGVRIP